ncbi:BatA domain-containing protein [Flagellimonas marinaquae]|uniref:BatA domain-containing protein n=1 Tax=Flagellimonas marinaquae TaxID=254955 RepID=UPI000F8DE925|nr:BatA domain-containing protein [Allomuricauda aquimarina]
MVFANPTYLWALLGLLVPLAIHLWSKKEANTVKIGSIQLLDESDSRQSSSVQLNEWLLMLLRMLILALIVLLMAGPQWRTKGNQKEITYLVEPSLANEPILTAILDSLQEDASVRLFKKGFPEWDLDTDYRSEQETPAYWQLAQRLDSLQSDSIVIFTKALVKGIKSKRPNTQKKIHWVVTEGEETQERPVMAFKNADAVQLVTVSSHGGGTQIKREIIEDGYQITTARDSLMLGEESTTTVPLRTNDTLQINLYFDEGFEREGQYVEASFRALSVYLRQPIQVQVKEERPNERADLQIWFSEEPFKPSDGKWLLMKPNVLAKQLIEPGPTPNIFHLTSRLNPKNTVEQRFTEQLLGILDVDKETKTLVKDMDRRQIDEATLKPNYVAPKRKRERATLVDVSLWVFGLVAGLMLVERLISKYRKQ